MSDNTREIWIDNWKGLLIFLVVIGHVVSGLRFHVDDEVYKGLDAIYKGIYLFHMPAFFFLAGYVGSKSGIVKKAQRLLVPYFVWGVISIFVFLALRGLISLAIDGVGYYEGIDFDVPWWQPFVSLLHAGEWPHGHGFRCNSVLWFLPCMFVVCAANGLLRDVKNKLGRYRWLLVVWMFIMAELIRLYAPHHLPWGLTKAAYYLSFYLLGEACAGIGCLKESGRRSCVGLVIGWLAYGFGAAHYPNLGIGAWKWTWYPIELAMAIGGCVLSLVTASIFSRSRLIISKFGVASLGIMLTHRFLILPLQVSYKWIAIRHSLLGSVVESAVLSTIVITLAYFVTRVVQRIVPWSLGEKG